MRINKILAVYSDSDSHAGITEALSGSFNEVVCVNAVYEAVRDLLNDTYSLVFVDSDMVDADNRDALTTLKTMAQIPIIVVKDIVCQGRAVSKLQMEQHLFEQANMKRDNKYDVNNVGGRNQKILVFDKLLIDPNCREVVLAGSKVCLTKIEFDILYFLARNKGRVFSRDRIYANVWIHGSSFDIDELVKAHIKRLRKKFASAEYEYIQNVRGIGYRFEV